MKCGDTRQETEIFQMYGIFSDLDHVVVEAERVEGDVVAEDVLGDGGEEVVVQPQLGQLLQRLESEVGDLVEVVVGQGQGFYPPAPREHLVTDGQQVISLEVQTLQGGKITEEPGNASQMVAGQVYSSELFVVFETLTGNCHDSVVVQVK